nr:hypothetical transcript [Hymenolepis microstoma]
MLTSPLCPTSIPTHNIHNQLHHYHQHHNHHQQINRPINPPPPSTTPAPSTTPHATHTTSTKLLYSRINFKSPTCVSSNQSTNTPSTASISSSSLSPTYPLPINHYHSTNSFAQTTLLLTCSQLPFQIPFSSLASHFCDKAYIIKLYKRYNMNETVQIMWGRCHIKHHLFTYQVPNFKLFFLFCNQRDISSTLPSFGS